MRQESVFSRQHSLKSFNGTSICLLNIRAWNAYLERFLKDSICQSYSSLFCFTETNINDSPVKHIDEVLDDWKYIDKNTQHVLVLCYKVGKVNIIDKIDIPSTVEILVSVLEVNMETFLLLILSTWSCWFLYWQICFIDEWTPNTTQGFNCGSFQS